MAKDRRRFLHRAAVINGASAASTAIPATASTASSALCSAPRARSSSSRCGTRRWPPSWPRPTPSSPASSASASPPPGPGAVASDHRALRRAARSHAGAGDRRAAGAHGARRPLPAGSRSRVAVQGRGRRLRPARRSMPAQVRHLIDRAVRIAHRRAPRDGADPARTTCRICAYEEPPRAHGTLHSGIGYDAPKIVPYEQRSAPRRRRPQRRQEGRDPGRRRRAARHRRGHRGRRPARRRASPRRCSARPCCPTICPGSPARSACSAPSRART